MLKNNGEIWTYYISPKKFCEYVDVYEGDINTRVNLKPEVREI
jgi:hypothetical protein